MVKAIEIEYSELFSFQRIQANFKLGIKALTTPETYEEDFANLVIEVKTKLNQITAPAKAAEDKLKERGNLKREEREQEKAEKAKLQRQKNEAKAFRRQLHESKLGIKTTVKETPMPSYKGGGSYSSESFNKGGKNGRKY